uniref:Arrestin_N domain-containing protein n=1 Tax=Rhabditophanes sp. KR3021 TaxID=114890 RepID=A0AC35TZ72_9BILA
MIGHISLHNPSYPYHGGDTVKGTFYLHNKAEKYINSIQIIFKGKSSVTTYRKDSNGNRPKKAFDDGDDLKHKRYEPTNGNFTSKHVLMIDRTTYLADQLLSKGHHEYNFSFLIPEDYPYSFEGHIGHIRYKITAKINYRLYIPIGMDLDKKCHIPIIIAPHYSTSLSQTSTSKPIKTGGFRSTKRKCNKTDNNFDVTFITPKDDIQNLVIPGLDTCQRETSEDLYANSITRIGGLRNEFCNLLKEDINGSLSGTLKTVQGTKDVFELTFLNNTDYQLNSLQLFIIRQELYQSHKASDYFYVKYFGSDILKDVQPHSMLTPFKVRLSVSSDVPPSMDFNGNIKISYNFLIRIVGKKGKDKKVGKVFIPIKICRGDICIEE